MTVGLVDFDSDIRWILVLLHTNGVCVTDSVTGEKKPVSMTASVSVLSLSSSQPSVVKKGNMKLRDK